MPKNQAQVAFTVGRLDPRPLAARFSPKNELVCQLISVQVTAFRLVRMSDTDTESALAALELRAEEAERELASLAQRVRV